MSKPINDDRLLPLAVCDDECEMCEAHSASDEGIFATVGDDEFSLLVYSHRNARRIGEWLIEWADAKENRDG